MAVHPAAQEGFARESDAYQRGRPEYPDALAGWLVDDLGLTPGRTVLDLGAGTGKFTRLLAGTGARVTAVEPVAAMADQIAARQPTVRVLAGTAEAIPLPAGSMDAIVCAQAFHWFANHAALGEIHRVLRPAGTLGLIWNVRDVSVDWVAELTQIMQPYEGDAPRFHSGQWRECFTGQTLFTQPVRSDFPNQHVGPFEQVVVDRVRSVSFIAALADPDKQVVLDQLRALRERFPQLRTDPVSVPYQTQAWRSARLAV